MPLVKVNDHIEQLFTVIDHYGGREYAGEDISVRDHLLQTACMAGAETNNPDLILAAFLHDIGHICLPPKEDEMMNGKGRSNHEHIGANFLAMLGFSSRVVNLVRLHVHAKRYLVYKQPGYYLNLTETGRECLDFQGGPMTQEEAGKFEMNFLFEEVLQLRKWDETAKSPVSLSVPIGYYRELAMYHLILQMNNVSF